MTPRLVQNRIRVDLLYRLRWNLLTDLHKIQIVLGSGTEDEIALLFNHSLAATNLGVPSLSRVEVNSFERLEKFDIDSDGDPKLDYLRPPSLVIENKDGRSITLGQFVTEVHAYLNEHLEEVKKAQYVVAAKPWSEILLFFQRTWTQEADDGHIIINVELMPYAEDAESRDILWAHQLRKAREHERHFWGRQ